MPRDCPLTYIISPPPPSLFFGDLTFFNAKIYVLNDYSVYRYIYKTCEY